MGLSTLAKTVELVNVRAAFKRFMKTFSFSHISLESPEFVPKLTVEVNEFDLWKFL